MKQHDLCGVCGQGCRLYCHHWINRGVTSNDPDLDYNDFRKLFLNIENLILNSAQEEFNQIFPEQILV
ncbi:hypothetical protein DERP_006736 [Dermatophagoides pteronyssinus]|uniref:Uncharacterized protein n=1 Tax=Dermatophagoides pteronyssinus TaxID=6956 RepID=A0ABQ8IS80_DERPT|nr:hypothetical protein DERP_006736 [Dermatophagoides pteronyssinus]